MWEPSESKATLHYGETLSPKHTETRERKEGRKDGREKEINSVPELHEIQFKRLSRD